MADPTSAAHTCRIVSTIGVAMYAAYLFVLHAAIAANAFLGFTAQVRFQAISPTMSVAGRPEPWLTFPGSTSITTLPAGLLIAPFGSPLFGIFGVIVLFMFLASAIIPSGRSRRNSPRLGLVIGLLALAIVTLVVNVAMP